MLTVTDMQRGNFYYSNIWLQHFWSSFVWLLNALSDRENTCSARLLRLTWLEEAALCRNLRFFILDQPVLLAPSIARILSTRATVTRRHLTGFYDSRSPTAALCLGVNSRCCHLGSFLIPQVASRSGLKLIEKLLLLGPKTAATERHWREAQWDMVNYTTTLFHSKFFLFRKL